MALRLNGQTSGYVELDVPAAAGSHTLTLPNSGGTSGQYLQTNGSGGLSWQTVTDTTTNLSESTVVSLSTQTEVDFDISALSTAPKRITMVLRNVSVSGNDNPIFQIGDSGGVETSGYITASGRQWNGGYSTNQWTDGWKIYWNGDALQINGHFTLTNVPNTNWWVGTGHFEARQSTSWYVWTFTGGAHELDGALQTVRLGTTGSNTLDGGTVHLQYEV